MTQRFILLTVALFFGFLRAEEDSYERRQIQNLNSATQNNLLQVIIDELEKIAAPGGLATQPILLGKAPLLFQIYPLLQNKISYASLCDLPTPIVNCMHLAARIGAAQLSIKNDGVTGPLVNGRRLFGGNKPRKLEFVLADARAHKAPTVLTFGCVGSNHALATGIYASLLGMKTICMLKNQPHSRQVRKALLMQLYYGAKLRHSPSYHLHIMAAADECLLHKQETGTFPYIIPTGASNALGSLGFVNAACELKEQIRQGISPEPDFIYVTLGSAGTVTGLLLGLQATGIKSHVVAIPDEPGDILELQEKVKRLYIHANQLLNEADPAFKLYEFPHDRFTILTGFHGTGYAVFTPEGMAAKKLLWETEHIELDGTYTAKAFSGMLAHIDQHKLHNKHLLFWNTYCGDNIPDAISDDYRKLPEPTSVF